MWKNIFDEFSLFYTMSNKNISISKYDFLLQDHIHHLYIIKVFDVQVKSHLKQQILQWMDLFFKAKSLSLQVISMVLKLR